VSQIRLYFDEDAAERAVITGIRDRGIDVLTVQEAGMASASDEEQLAYATSEGRTVYTLNVGDFCRLHAEYLAAGKDHSGILVIPRQRYSVGEKIRRLIAHIAGVSALDIAESARFSLRTGIAQQAATSQYLRSRGMDSRG
jgi:Domain of unknown function (DUF5615)